MTKQATKDDATRDVFFFYNAKSSCRVAVSRSSLFVGRFCRSFVNTVCCKNQPPTTVKRTQTKTTMPRNVQLRGTDIKPQNRRLQEKTLVARAHIQKFTVPKIRHSESIHQPRFSFDIRAGPPTANTFFRIEYEITTLRSILTKRSHFPRLIWHF